MTGKYNATIKRAKGKRYAPLGYIPLIVTKPGEWLAKKTFQGATYTYRNGSTGIRRVEEITAQGYGEAKKLGSKLTGKDEDYLFKVGTHLVDKGTEIVGEGISTTGQHVYDSHKTKKDNIL